MTRNIYLCGPVTGRARQDAVDHFSKVETKIRGTADIDDMHVHTLNPMRFCPPDFDWHKAMRICVGELRHCHGIALLQGWRHSKGAMLELRLAQDLHIPVVYVEPPYDTLHDLFAVAPEVSRYLSARISIGLRQGWSEAAAEDRATAELANRYLDPHGFEYINPSQEE